MAQRGAYFKDGFEGGPGQAISDQITQAIHRTLGHYFQCQVQRLRTPWIIEQMLAVVPQSLLLQATQMARANMNTAGLWRLGNDMLNLFGFRPNSQLGLNIIKEIGPRFFPGAGIADFQNISPNVLRQFSALVLKEMNLPQKIGEAFFRQLNEPQLVALGRGILSNIPQMHGLARQIPQHILGMKLEDLGNRFFQSTPSVLLPELARRLGLKPGIPVPHNLQGMLINHLPETIKYNYLQYLIKEDAIKTMELQGRQLLQNIDARFLTGLGGKLLAGLDTSSITDFGNSLLNKVGTDLFGKMFGQLGVNIDELRKLEGMKGRQILERLGEGALRNVAQGILNGMGVDFAKIGAPRGMLGKVGAFISQKLLGNLPAKIGGALAKIGGGAIGKIGGLIQGISSKLGVVGKIAGAIGALATGKLTIADAIKVGLSFIPGFGQIFAVVSSLPIIGPIINKVIGAIGKFIDKIPIVGKLIKGVLKGVGKIAKGIVKAGKAVWKGVKKVGKAIGKGIKKVGQAIAKGAKKVWNTIKKY